MNSNSNVCLQYHGLQAPNIALNWATFFDFCDCFPTFPSKHSTRKGMDVTSSTASDPFHKVCNIELVVFGWHHRFVFSIKYFKFYKNFVSHFSSAILAASSRIRTRYLEKWVLWLPNPRSLDIQIIALWTSGFPLWHTSGFRLPSAFPNCFYAELFSWVVENLSVSFKHPQVAKWSPKTFCIVVKYLPERSVSSRSLESSVIQVVSRPKRTGFLSNCLKLWHLHAYCFMLNKKTTIHRCVLHANTSSVVAKKPWKCSQQDEHFCMLER